MRPRPLDLGLAVRRAAQAVRRLLPSDLELRVDVAPDPLVVRADPHQLLQILLNLAQNSRDAIVGGGIITVTVSPCPGSHAALRVTDTGQGIPPEIVPRIFEPFYTTKGRGAGTGLGLSNVLTLTQDLGGTVAVSSEVGRGTEVTVTLPLTDEPSVMESPPTPAAVDRFGRILVVDDDVRVRAVAFTALERAGYTVVEAASPGIAEALLRDRGQSFDLVLTDVVMEGGGGARVLELVQKHQPAARVLVMSGYAASETVRRGIEQGKVPFLAKPFGGEELLNAVDSTLARRRPEDPS